MPNWPIWIRRCVTWMAKGDPAVAGDSGAAPAAQPGRTTISPELFLVRHGRPSVRYSHTPWRWIRAGELNAQFDAYDLAGLEPEWNRQHLERARTALAPDAQLRFAGARVLSSDLPRAVDTAALYTGRPTTGIPTDAQFREVPLARFDWTWLKLPTVFLLSIARLGWLSGAMRCEEHRPATLRRVDAAADFLEGLFGNGEGDGTARQPIALYAHGFFLWLLGRELKRRGWRSEKEGPYRYLEIARFER